MLYPDYLLAYGQSFFLFASCLTACGIFSYLKYQLSQARCLALGRHCLGEWSESTRLGLGCGRQTLKTVRVNR